MNTKKIKFDHFIYIAFSIFYIWMAAQIPYTHDDWDWGLDIGLQQWLTASVNSRYAGNFFEVVMTRSVVLKTLIMGGAFFLLPYILSRIAANHNKEKQPLLFLAANFLILTMSRFIWSETYGWVAGFANFGLSSIFALLCLNQWLRLCSKDYKPEKHSTVINILFFLLALCGQLFIENLSIIMAAASVAACTCSFIRSKKIPTHYILMCLGCLVGLCIMFSSSVYSALFGAGEAVDGYRKLIISAGAGLSSIIFGMFVQGARLVTRAGEANFVLCISVLTVLSYKLITLKEAKSSTRKALLTINVFFAIYFTVNFILQTDYTANKLLLSAFAAMVNGLYFMLVPLEALYIYNGNRTMQSKLVAIWFIGISLLVPLIVTNEAGYRLIFSMNITVILFVLWILEDILFTANWKIASLRFIFTSATLFPVVVCIVVYTAIGTCNYNRLELIEKASISNIEEIILPAYPYANYLHAPDPIDEIRLGFFKEFYGIDSDVTVTIDTPRQG